MDNIVKKKKKKMYKRNRTGDRGWQNRHHFCRPEGPAKKHKGSAEERGKPERSWLGPYEIVHLQEKSADLRDEKGFFPPKINTDHLKPFK